MADGVGRAGEEAAAFNGSMNQVAGKNLKVAIQREGNQSEVWKSVAENQAKLSGNAGHSVADPRSASSYELTLENKSVEDAKSEYVKSLVKTTDGQADVIGYVTAINGAVSSADIYSSHELFMKLWPKLLNSASVEAFTELQKDKKFEAVKPDAIKHVIEDADQAKASQKDVTGRVQLVTSRVERQYCL